MTRPRHYGARAQAATLLAAFKLRRLSLSCVLADGLDGFVDPRDKALTQALCYGVVRCLFRLEAIAARLMSKPLKGRDADIHFLILLGLYQILSMRVPEHALVSTTVAASKELGKPWARGLINAVLRNFLREKAPVLQAVDRDLQARYAHPRWLMDCLRQQRPQHWQEILEAGNAHPPMSLRVNQSLLTRDAYLQILAQQGLAARANRYVESAVILESPVMVDQLPGFEEGKVSVQDGAAQLATMLLEPCPGHRVLDACAAPGGKTCHILEQEPDIGSLLAIDSDAGRMRDVSANMDRLGLEASLRVADAGDIEGWWDGQGFDRILLDAPCSATGVIRRHPDIKYLRRPSDINSLVLQQRRLLKQLWTVLRPGGVLLYATCSILRDENEGQMVDFVAAHDDVSVLPIQSEWGHDEGIGRQILTGEGAMDGFYYARLCKQS